MELVLYIYITLSIIIASFIAIGDFVQCGKLKDSVELWLFSVIIGIPVVIIDKIITLIGYLKRNKPVESVAEGKYTVVDIFYTEEDGRFYGFFDTLEEAKEFIYENCRTIPSYTVIVTPNGENNITAEELMPDFEYFIDYEHEDDEGGKE